MKLRQVLEKRTALQHSLAVWEELHVHLDLFLPQDAGAAESLLEVEDCLIHKVSVDVISEVQENVANIVEAIRAELESLEATEVKDGSKQPRKDEKLGEETKNEQLEIKQKTGRKPRGSASGADS